MKTTMTRKSPKYVMILRSLGNPDFNEDPTEAMSAPRAVKAETLAAMVQAAEDYRDQNALGGGNWVTPVVMENGRAVATISYNGRVWAMDDSEIKLS